MGRRRAPPARMRSSYGFLAAPRAGSRDAERPNAGRWCTRSRCRRRHALVSRWRISRACGAGLAGPCANEFPSLHNEKWRLSTRRTVGRGVKSDIGHRARSLSIHDSRLGAGAGPKTVSGS
ncbi:PREDICTED: uncharacterized protein LOC105566303 [Vollenhovia emeryi]|uniref:uncharacterized protein LOC105566303 n=1 Tax=Vollenhovia emeryi TaxID=411798 RepID=UPI0005F40B60|nr:PREDICTED: uncharacterized protein LOC105566303 [Vollenhovia emeryi]